MVAGDYQVERVEGEPAAVVVQLEQLRLGAVEVDGVAVLHNRLALEERGDGGEFLVAEEDGLGARVEEGEVAALRVDCCGGRRVSLLCVALRGRGMEGQFLQLCVMLISTPFMRTPSSWEVQDIGARRASS